MPRLVASSASSGRNDFFAGAGVAVAALSAGAEARAAIGREAQREEGWREAGARHGRGRSSDVARRVWRADTESRRPPADLVPTTDLPSRPRQPGGEGPRGAPYAWRRPCGPRAGERPCERPCDGRPCAQPCGARPCERRGDEPPCARPCDAPPCGRPCGARPCGQPSWLCDDVPSPALLCVGLAIPEILSGRWLRPGNESFRLYGRTVSMRIASSGRDSCVTQRAGSRGDAFAVHSALYDHVTTNASVNSSLRVRTSPRRVRR